MNRFFIITILLAILSLNNTYASVASVTGETTSRSDESSQRSVSPGDIAGYIGVTKTLTAAASSPTPERTSSAINAWNDHKEFSGYFDPKYLASAATNLGNIGARKLAKEAWVTLLARKDLNCRVLCNAGITLVDIGVYDLANIAFKALIYCEDNSPGSHNALFEAAKFLYKQGEIRLARKMWKKYLNHRNVKCTDLYDAAQYFKRERALGKKDLSREELGILGELETMTWIMLNEILQSMPAEGNEPLKAEVDQALRELTPIT
jgi:tetratricopeptide (TPR) repeat protein